MEYGTFVGLSWGALFLSYVEGISRGNGLLVFLCLILCGATILLPFLLALRLNRKLLQIGQKLNYWQGVLFAFSMFMYACIMNGIVVFAYFQFFDDGMLMEQLTRMATQPEMVDAYKQLGMDEQYAQVTDMIREVDALSPFEKTLAVFNNNFVFSAIASFFVAIAAAWRGRSENS